MGSSRRRVLGVVQTYESFHNIIIKEKQRENTVDDWLDYRTAEKGYCTAQDTSSFVTHVAREWVIRANYYTHTCPCLKSGEDTKWTWDTIQTNMSSNISTHRVGKTDSFFWRTTTRSWRDGASHTHATAGKVGWNFIFTQHILHRPTFITTVVFLLQ